MSPKIMGTSTPILVEHPPLDEWSRKIAEEDLQEFTVQEVFEGIINLFKMACTTHIHLIKEELNT